MTSPAIRRYVEASAAYWRLRRGEIEAPTHRDREVEVSARSVSTPMRPETRKAAHAALAAHQALTDEERAEVASMARVP